MSADPSDLLGAARGSAEQWREGARRARANEGIPTGDGCTAVVFAGMGGSGIAGDLLAASPSRLPVVVVKSDTLPAWVDANTFVVCTSYSGNTDETLACFDEAVARKARTVVISTGGAITDRARANGIPVIAPVSVAVPRAAFASMCAQTLVIAERAGILPAVDIEDASTALDANVDAFERDAEQLAARLDGSLPIVWGWSGPLAVAADRWRCQFNENAKVPSYSATLPELDHNDVVGYEPGVAALAQMTIIVLRAAQETPAARARIDATLEEVRGARVEQVRAPAGSPLAQFAALSLLGDLTSIHLALRRGLDPAAMEPITRIKNRLR